MIEPIADLPAGVLGFTAKGLVTADDYESVIIPTVEGHFARHKKVRLIYHLGEDFSGFEGAAMWDDTKLGFRHITGWERIAVVSDIEWIRAAMKIFSLVIPGRVRVFANDDLSEAVAWVSET